MEHLPECHWANPLMKAYSDIVFGRDYPCQMCKALRACEQRVLDAAREALEGLSSDMANWSSAETVAATNAIPDLNVEQWMWAQRGVYRAIAAIDALRNQE